MNKAKNHFFILTALLILLALSCATTLEITEGNTPPHFPDANEPTAKTSIPPFAKDIDMSWSAGTATPSEECGICHNATYREFALGYGADLHYKGIVYKSLQDKLQNLPAHVSSTGTAHALAGVDPYPIHARDIEEGGRSCNVCHFPEAFNIPDIEISGLSKPTPRPKEHEEGGMTCASCHLTPDGNIRGPNMVKAPHKTIQDVRMKTSAICAYCHSVGKRIIGKQAQTFFEWRDDFYKPELGNQHCQDCHMPRTLRKSAESFDVPVKAVARHLWTGGHSMQRTISAFNLVVIQGKNGQPNLEFHVINIGAGHSVPTGSNRRAIYLNVNILDKEKNTIASHSWMFAPWYGNRPDDQAFLEEDEKRHDSFAAIQADLQGPHETPIRAAEERVLTWTPDLKAGGYTVETKMVYDLNRYNEYSFSDDQSELSRILLSLKVE